MHIKRKYNWSYKYSCFHDIPKRSNWLSHQFEIEIISFNLLNIHFNSFSWYMTFLVHEHTGTTSFIRGKITPYFRKGFTLSSHKVLYSISDFTINFSYINILALRRSFEEITPYIFVRGYAVTLQSALFCIRFNDYFSYCLLGKDDFSE